MRGIALAALFCALAAPASAAPDPHPAALVGFYDGGQMEMAAALELKADGHFQYALSYGAIDETAEGRWEADGKQLWLTTEPAVIPPRFTVTRDTPAAGLRVTLAGPDWLTNISPIELVLFYKDDARGHLIEMDSASGPVPLPDKRLPRAILPILPVFGPVTEPVPIDDAHGHDLLLTLEPHDLGRVDFRRTPLAIEQGALLLDRYDRHLRFRRN